MRAKRIFKLITEKLVDGLVFLSKTMNRFHSGRIAYDKIFEDYCYRAGRSINSFITYHRRPSLAVDVHSDSLFPLLSSYSEYAIVIQGPLCVENNFTVETVKLYVKNFPGSKIIVSTWVGSDKSIIRQLEVLGCLVILSSRPSVSGSHNVNYQIVSTAAGVELASSMGCKYLLKTRCDQRFYSSDCLRNLRCYLEAYPVSLNSMSKGRIIELSIAVCRYRLWSMCDMFQFGYIEDMRRMWSLPLDPRSRTHSEFDLATHKVRDLVEENIAEIYIHRHYARGMGLAADIAPEDYYEFMVNYMLILDKEHIDIFWNKYSASEFGWVAHPLYRERQVLSRVTHLDWLMLFSGVKPDYEKCRLMLDEYEH